MKTRTTRFITKLLIGILISFTLSVVVSVEYQNPLRATTVYAQDAASSSSGTPAPSPAPSDSSGVTKVEVVNKVTLQQILDRVGEVSRYLFRLFHPLVNFLAFHIGNFLGNDYIYSGPMGTMLKSIWTMTRNLVNIVAILLMLGFGLKQMFSTKDSDNFKGLIIKMAILLVAVNFSWLATKIILDAGNVAANVVFSIPTGVETMTTGKVELAKCEPKTNEKGEVKPGPGCLPSYISVSFKEDSTLENIFSKEACKAKQDEIKEVARKVHDKETLGEDDKKILNTSYFCYDDFSLFAYKKNTSAIYLVYGMARIQNLIFPEGNNDVFELSISIIFSLVMMGAYLLALLALFIVCIVRMAWLWVLIAFSPIMVLLLPFTFGSDLKADIKQISFTRLIELAFTPAKVGAIFTIAFLMLAAGQTLQKDNSSWTESLNQGFTLNSNSIQFSSLFQDLGGRDQFIWMIIVVVVLWTGVFAILSKVDLAKSVIDQIKSKGDAVGKIAQGLPGMAPIIPQYEDGKFKGMTSFNKSALNKLMPENILKMLEEEGEIDVSKADKLDKIAKKINSSPEDIEKLKELVSNAKSEEIAKMLGHDSAKDAQENKVVLETQIKTIGNGIDLNSVLSALQGKKPELAAPPPVSPEKKEP